MNAHVSAVLACAALAFALESVGPVDAQLTRYVVGGADCNHSDHVEFDCVEINGRTEDCNNPMVGADTVQQCKDEIVESRVVCTETNCQNETKLRFHPVNGTVCTRQGCGS